MSVQSCAESSHRSTKLTRALVVCTVTLAACATAGAQELPAPRAHHQLAWHEGEQRVFLVGGSTPRDGGHHFFDDIWSWDGTAWQRAGSLPFPRSSHRVAWDAARNALVLFGGGSGRTFTADSLFRAWDGTAWQAIGHSPYGGLAEPGMCHDRKRSRLVLFGGWNAANRFHGGTWEWTGDTLLSIAAAGPSARGGHMFVYDPQRQRCLLFGGMSDNGVLADTWEWDGSAWQQLHAPGPAARMIGGAATDYANDRIILFSGWTADQTLLDDTWSWDGETWELIGRGGPLPRISAPLAFDGTGVVLFGGRTRTADGFRDLNDTWRLEGRTWVRADVPQTADSIGDGGPGTRAILVAPEGVALDADGNIYVSERAAHRVRRIDASTGMISTFAGTGQAGYSGDGGAATRAQVSLPADVAVDSHGNVYIAEPGTHRIRRVDAATGMITTFAGTGVSGFSGDGGPASRATLSSPFGVAVDSHDNVYVSDTDNQRIRRIDAATGLIRTVVGNGTVGFGGDGGAATDASLARPHRVVPAPNGDLYVGDSFNHRIRRVDARTGVIRTIVGTGRLGSGGDGGLASDAAITYTGGLALDSAGGLVFTDLAAHRVRRVDLATGTITTIAGSGRWDFGGDDGPAVEAALHLPASIAVSRNGDLLFTDMWNGRIRRVSASTGDLTTVAGSRLSPPTPEVSFHFHYDADSLRRDLDARVAVHDPLSGRVMARILSVPLAGRDVPIRMALYPSLPPAAGIRPPLVVLLHGRSNYEWSPLEWGGLRSWAWLLAARGMSAAVVEHGLGSMPASLAAADADVAAALEHLIRDAAASLDFDPARVCVLSFGGASALLTRFVSDPPDHLRCVAMFSPHTSLLPADLYDWFLESPADRERYSLSGAITAASPPLFLAIGSRDRSMLTESFRAFVQMAADRGVTVEVVEHPAGGADFERLVHDDASRAAIERALAFLIGHLR